MTEKPKVTEKKKKDKKIEEIHLLDDKVEELEQKLLYKKAELQNFIRRSNEEFRNATKYASEELALKILPTLDNFERAIKMEEFDKTEETEKFLSGFEMIEKNLIENLKNAEVTEMESIGKEFSPEFHQAVLTEENPEVEDGIITDVLQKGYMLKDKVIRPAMVKVNKNKKEKGDDK